MKIPVSLLSAYLYCSRKVFLEEVLLLEEPPKESLILGTIRHEAYDWINKIEEDIVASITKPITLEEIQSIYKHNYLKILRQAIVKNKNRMDEVSINLLDAYRGISPFILEESLMRASNVFNFIAENNIYGDELWAKLSPKIISEFKVESEELRLKGIIDQVHIYHDQHIPFELKTGSMPNQGVWPSHRIQIAAYSLLLQEKFDKPVKEGFIYYLDKKEKRQLSINPFMKDEVIKIVNEIISLLENKNIPDFCSNQNKCRKCGLKETCYNEEEVSNLLRIKLNN